MDTENSIVINPSEGISAVIDTLNKFAEAKKYVFRGYSKQDELLPNILRDNAVYANEEKNLLMDFERYGSHYFHASTPIDLMSYAQHFGLPTRLLDFTYNPFIALSFSLHGLKGTKYKEPTDKDYYYIRYASIEDNMLMHSIPFIYDANNTQFANTDSLAVRAGYCIDSVAHLFGETAVDLTGMPETIRIAEEKIKKRTILFIDSNQSNQRMIMQQGLFMFPYNLNADDHLRILHENSSKIMIHKDLRSDLIKYLDTLGFNAFRLMPDLENICKAIKQKVKDERAEKR